MEGSMAKAKRSGRSGKSSLTLKKTSIRDLSPRGGGRVKGGRVAKSTACKL
jgi:hypothetical protein